MFRGLDTHMEYARLRQGTIARGLYTLFIFWDSILMLIISEDDFLAELASSGISRTPINKISTDNHDEPNTVEKVEMENHTYDSFRKPTGPNIPKEVKAIIGSLAITEGHDEVKDAFPVSKQTVGELARDDHKNAEVSELKANVIERIRSAATDKIEKCVEFLDVSKGMKNSELIMVADGLARVHEKLTPKEQNTSNITQFIYYVPERQKKIEDYEVIDAST